MDEARKDLLKRMIKILVIIGVLFALWQIFASDIGKNAIRIFENIGNLLS